MAQNDRGEWVPAIPLPYYYFGKRICKCNCDRLFMTQENYRAHYALVHILGLS